MGQVYLLERSDSVDYEGETVRERRVFNEPYKAYSALYRYYVEDLEFQREHVLLLKDSIMTEREKIETMEENFFDEEEGCYSVRIIAGNKKASIKKISVE